MFHSNIQITDKALSYIHGNLSDFRNITKKFFVLEFIE